MGNHAEKLNKVIERVKQLNRSGQKAYIYHGSTNTTRAFNFTRENIVDLSDFGEVLEINEKEKYVVCEPNVPMDKLVEATLPFNLTPPVVMDFPGITVGGGISGGAGESSSFKYGLFNHTVIECEVVLGNGECLTVSREASADLFWGLAATLGSLAIVTKIKLKLIETKKYVKLNYLPVYSFKELVDKTAEMTASAGVEFIDGIMFSKNLGAVVYGSPANEIGQNSKVTFNKPWNEWFYLHAQKKVRAQNPQPDFIPLKDYYFRYNKGAFWMGWYYFLLFKIPFNRITRIIFSKWLHTRNLYRALHAGNMSQKYFIQDLSLPHEKTVEFFNYVDSNLGIYPLWLWPIKPTNQTNQTDKMSQTYMQTSLVMNVGVWGTNKNIEENFIEKNRELEKFLLTINGRKMFYAHNYYPKEEFWQVYDRTWYENLRKKYFAEHLFPDVFEKLLVKGKYKAQVFRGFLKFLVSKKLKIK